MLKKIIGWQFQWSSKFPGIVKFQRINISIYYLLETILYFIEALKNFSGEDMGVGGLSARGTRRNACFKLQQTRNYFKISQKKPGSGGAHF